MRRHRFGASTTDGSQGFRAVRVDPMDSTLNAYTWVRAHGMSCGPGAAWPRPEPGGDQRIKGWS